MKLDQLATVAQEMNTVLGLDPVINIKGAEGYLKMKIKEASVLLTADDKLTPLAKKTIIELVKAVEKGDKMLTLEDKEQLLGLIPTLSSPSPVKKTEDEDEEADVEIQEQDEDEEADINALIREIKKTDTLKDLKDLCKVYDEFKPLRDKLSKFTTKDALRGVMLKTLKEEVDVPTAPIAPKPTPKESKPQQKGKEKKNTYTRIDSVCEVILQSVPATVEELITKADALYVQHGGISNMKESKFVAKYIVKALPHFGVKVPKE